MVQSQKSTSKTGVGKRVKKAENGDLTGFSVLLRGYPYVKLFFPHVFLNRGKVVETLDTRCEALEIQGNDE